jgi:copper chaperone CopZ
MRYASIGFICAAVTAAGCQGSCGNNGSNGMRDHGTHDRSASTNNPSTGVSAQPDTAVLTVHGMGCPQCANNVDSQLMKVPGVESVTIDMGSGKVLAKLSPDKHPTRDQLAKAIDETGFTLVKIDMPQ